MLIVQSAEHGKRNKLNYINMKTTEQRKYFNSCNRCCFDLKDDEGDILEHYCIDNELYIPPIN